MLVGARTTGPVISRRRLIAEWGDFLSSLRWTHFCTLTFEYEASVSSAFRSLKRFARRVGRKAQVRWFAVAERGVAGLVHLHVLLDVPGQLSPDHLVGEWRVGRVEVEEYDSSRGAGYYLAKGMGTQCDDYGFSDCLPEHIG